MIAVQAVSGEHKGPYIISYQFSERLFPGILEILNRNFMMRLLSIP